MNMSRRRTFLIVGVIFNFIALYWIFLSVIGAGRVYYAMFSLFMLAAVGFYLASLVSKPD